MNISFLVRGIIWFGIGNFGIYEILRFYVEKFIIEVYVVFTKSLLQPEVITITLA